MEKMNMSSVVVLAALISGKSTRREIEKFTGYKRRWTTDGLSSLHKMNYTTPTKPLTSKHQKWAVNHRKLFREIFGKSLPKIRVHAQTPTGKREFTIELTADEIERENPISSIQVHKINDEITLFSVETNQCCAQHETSCAQNTGFNAQDENSTTKNDQKTADFDPLLHKINPIESMVYEIIMKNTTQDAANLVGNTQFFGKFDPKVHKINPIESMVYGNGGKRCAQDVWRGGRKTGIRSIQLHKLNYVIASVSFGIFGGGDGKREKFHKVRYIYTTYILFIYNYVMEKIKNFLIGVSANEQIFHFTIYVGDVATRVKINSPSATASMPAANGGCENDTITNGNGNDKLLSTAPPGNSQGNPDGEKIHKLTLEYIARRRNGKSRGKYTDVARELVRYWNELEHTPTHKSATTKTFKRAVKKLELLLSGGWARQFVLAESVRGRYKPMIESRRKFTPDEIRDAMEMFDYEIGVGAMKPVPLEKFIYNDRSRRSMFLALFSKSDWGVELDYFRQILGDDFEYIHRRLKTACDDVGRPMPPDGVLEQMYSDLLVIRDRVDDMRRRAERYVKTNMSNGHVNVMVGLVQKLFKFRAAVGYIFDEYEQRNPTRPIGELVGRWMFHITNDVVLTALERFERDMMSDLKNQMGVYDAI